MLLIKEKAELHQIVSAKKQKINLDIQELSVEENKSLENNINYLLNDCGCASGRKTVKTTLPLSILLSILSSILFEFNIIKGLLSFLFFLFFFGLTGKVIALYTNKLKLKKIIKQL